MGTDNESRRDVVPQVVSFDGNASSVWDPSNKPTPVEVGNLFDLRGNFEDRVQRFFSHAHWRDRERLAASCPEVVLIGDSLD